MQILTLYLQSFRFRFPNHSLSNIYRSQDTKLVVQTTRGIHDTEDAGAELYRLFSLIFDRKLGMVPATGKVI